MLAYHNNQAIKATYLARVRAHRKADELIKGQYWKNGKGCAVGCTVHSSSHADYEIELGIPEQLARLEDAIFEGLPNGMAKRWPEKFLSAIKPGADLSLVRHRFAAWLLSAGSGLLKIVPENKSFIAAVAALHQRAGRGEIVSDAEWSAARSAAWAVAESAWSDAESAAWYADSAAAARFAAEVRRRAWRLGKDGGKTSGTAPVSKTSDNKDAMAW